MSLKPANLEVIRERDFNHVPAFESTFPESALLLSRITWIECISESWTNQQIRLLIEQRWVTAMVEMPKPTVSAQLESNGLRAAKNNGTDQ